MKLGTTVFLGAAGLLSLGLFTTLSVEGCSSSDSGSNPPGGDAGPTGSTGPTGSDGGTPSPDGSAPVDSGPSIVPPGPPTAGPTTSTSEHNFAVHHIHLGDETTAPWQNFGYNLDGKVTTAQSTDVCTLGTNASKKNQVDGPGGIDNSFGENIVGLISAVAANPSQTITASIAAGKFTVMVDVTGLSDDATQSATGITGKLFGGVPFFQGPNAATALPTFTTADNWPLDKTYITSTINSDNTLVKPVTSNVTFSGAYVTNGEFVNGAPTEAQLILTISGVALPIDIKHAYITFNHSAPGKATGGMIAGVINTADLIKNLQGVAGNISTAFCSGSAFQQVETSIQGASDIMSDGTNAPGTPCDAISIGLGFDADEIGLPQVAGEPAKGTNPCDAGTPPTDDGGTDSGTDAGTGDDAGDGG